MSRTQSRTTLLRSHRMALAVLAATVVMISIRVSLSPSQTRRRAAGPKFRPIRVVREFPAIKDVPIIRADQVKRQVSASELVLGVVVNDQARAYPINMLTGPSREIINDKLGGRAIAATW